LLVYLQGTKTTILKSKIQKQVKIHHNFLQKNKTSLPAAYKQMLTILIKKIKKLFPILKKTKSFKNATALQLLKETTKN